jgi:hypothetical protein
MAFWYSLTLVLLQYILRILAQIGCSSNKLSDCEQMNHAFQQFQQIWELCSDDKNTDQNWQFAPRGQLCARGTIHTGFLVAAAILLHRSMLHRRGLWDGSIRDEVCGIEQPARSSLDTPVRSAGKENDLEASAALETAVPAADSSNHGYTRADSHSPPVTAGPTVSTRQRFAEKLREVWSWFDPAVAHSAGADYYTALFCLELLFFFLLAGLVATQKSLVAQIESSEISWTTIFWPLLQFFSMVFERVCYMLRNFPAKFMLQFFSLLWWHYYLFFNGLEPDYNPWVLMLYAVKTMCAPGFVLARPCFPACLEERRASLTCRYWVLSAVQLSQGYPRGSMHQGRFLMNSMSLTMWLAYAPMRLAHCLLLRFRVGHLFRACLVLRRQSLRLGPINNLNK